MPDPELIAQRLARCVELFRDPDAKQVQKAEFRALLGLLKDQTVVITESAGELVVNGVAVQGKVGSLIQRIGLHNVGEITIQPHAPPSDVFELLRALSDQPALGTEDIPTRLRQAGVNQVTVAIADFAPPARVSGPTSRAASESDDVLGDLERNPQAPDVSRLLDALVRQVETAFKAGRFEEVLTLIAGISRGHQAVPRGSDARRHYGIAFKRVYTKAMLDRLAHLVSVPKHRSDAILALQRAGAGGVKVLIDLLVAAPTMSERRVLFDALSQMKEGTGQLVQMLDHRQWFVVRNGAELVGELALEEAVPALARQLEHPDDRVRKAVALALAKIGSGSAAEPLLHALRDKSPEVRMQVALGIGGLKAGALAMPLVVAMEEEQDEAVERELILALGRIGSPDAVLALIKVAQPAGRFFGRKPTVLRVAAVEALRLAGTAVAIGTIEGLVADSDAEVKEAAQAALVDLKKRR